MSRTRPVVLISPPAYYPWCVSPAVAYLGAYLRTHGIPTIVIDANIGALEYIVFARTGSRSDTRHALDVLRDAEAASNWRAYASAADHVGEVVAGVGSSSEERLLLRRNTYRYFSAFNLRSRAGLLAAALAPHKHIFTDYYRDILIPRLQDMRPALVGVSASDLHQLLPGTVIAATLRRSMGSDCPRLVFGGNVFSRIWQTLQTEDALNDALHAIWGTVIVGEGEVPLLELARDAISGATNGGGNGILVRGDRQIAKSAPMELDALPTPAISGLMPLVPRPTIPLNIYRGCYYSGICAFCDINHGYDTIWQSTTPRLTARARRFRSFDSIVGDIRQCTPSEGPALISFTDEWFRACDMIELAHRIEADELNVQWEAYARFEEAFTDPGVARLLAQSGCRFLQFGLESASDATLQSVHKGTSSELAQRVLATLADAGIWNHVFVIVGLPGERLHDTLLTAAFLLDHARHIFTIKPTRFRVSSQSPYARGTRKDEWIAVHRPEPPEDIALNLPFEYRMIGVCRRCHTIVRTTLVECPNCRDHLVHRRTVSKRAVNAMHTAIELVAGRHWAYPFTSLYPYSVRMHFTHEEATRIAEERREVVDHQMGLSQAAVIACMNSLLQYLKAEADVWTDIAQIYDTANLELPDRWRNVQEFAAFSQLWQRARSGKSRAIVGSVAQADLRTTADSNHRRAASL